jgi:hypothetical protein
VANTTKRTGKIGNEKFYEENNKKRMKITVELYDYDNELKINLWDKTRVWLAGVILGERLWKEIHHFLTRGYFEEHGWSWDTETRKWVR